MSEHLSNGTVLLRLTNLEREQEVQRQRLHDLNGDLHASRLLLQQITDHVEHLSEEVKTLKRAFYTFAFGAVGASVTFALSVFALLGHA